jgi:hypothetical protein
MPYTLLHSHPPPHRQREREGRRERGPGVTSFEVIIRQEVEITKHNLLLGPCGAGEAFSLFIPAQLVLGALNKRLEFVLPPTLDQI